MSQLQTPEEDARRKVLVSRLRKVLSGTIDAGQQRMVEGLLTSFRPAAFPYAVEAVWEYFPGYTNLGRGGLVFADNANAAYEASHEPSMVLCVEVKFLSKCHGATAKTRRTKQRQKVREQLTASMRHWHKRHPHDQVYGYKCVNEGIVEWMRAEQLQESQSEVRLDLSDVVRILDALSLEHSFTAPPPSSSQPSLPPSSSSQSHAAYSIPSSSIALPSSLNDVSSATHASPTHNPANPPFLCNSSVTPLLDACLEYAA